MPLGITVELTTKRLERGRVGDVRHVRTHLGNPDCQFAKERGKIEVSRAARKFRKTPREERRRGEEGGRGRGRERPPPSPPPTEPHTKLLSLVMGDQSVPLVGREAAAILPISLISLALASAVVTRHVSQIPRPPANKTLPPTLPPQTQGYFRTDIAIGDYVPGLRFWAPCLWIYGDGSH